MAQGRTNNNSVWLNEWGIPDWRDKEAYGDVDGWTIDRWRWEFYRRRDDLRKCFDDRADAEYRSNQLQLNDLTICVDVFKGKSSEPGFTVSYHKSRQLFGYLSIPNPRIGAQPEGLIKPIEGYWGYLNAVDGSKRDGEEATGRQVKGRLALAGVVVNPEQKRILESSLLDAFPVMLDLDEVAIKFDLRKPLEPQIEKAREVLRSSQTKLNGGLLQERQQRSKWLGYLRTLDAKEDNAKWSEIGSMHPHMKQNPHTGRDVWKQAHRLCFNF